MIDNKILKTINYFGKFDIDFLNSKSAEVEFVDGTLYPSMTIAKVARGYKGIYSNDMPDNPKELLNDVKSTKLQTPMEMITFVFLLKRVSRAFTHQLVRTRHASYVQESMRFLGHKNTYEILVTNKVRTNPEAFELYTKTCGTAVYEYEHLLDSGMPSEDARGVLPTNIMTSIFVHLPLSSLQRIYTQRLCCQAQEEWYHVVKEFKKALKIEYGNEVDEWLSAPVERGEPCGYNASFDRPCVWKNGKEEEN